MTMTTEQHAALLEACEVANEALEILANLAWELSTGPDDDKDLFPIIFRAPETDIRGITVVIDYPRRARVIKEPAKAA